MLKLQKFKSLFTVSKKLHSLKQRRTRKSYENQVNTERYKESLVPYMQKLLNKEDRVLKNLLSNSHSKLSHSSALDFSF